MIDTGININHVDFEGRAHWGTTTVPGAPNTDDNGHGTFVAGVIGSRTFGVAKKVNLIAVKGLNREGTSTLSQILAALDWVIKQSVQSSNHRAVVNLSLGAGYSKVLNAAVDTLVQAGLFIVAAAGERVRSTWIGPTNREIYTDSGTSFSAPNVAGIAALVMSVERGDRPDGSWSPRNIGNRILQLGTRNVIRNFKGPDNTNLLAFNGVGILGATNSVSNDVDNPEGNGSHRDGGGENSPSGVPSSGGGNDQANPPSVSGSHSVGSTTNHGPTLNAIHVLTVLATLSSTASIILSSL